MTPSTQDARATGLVELERIASAARTAEVCAVLATLHDSKGNAQISNWQRPTSHRIAAAYEAHLVAIRNAIEALAASTKDQPHDA